MRQRVYFFLTLIPLIILIGCSKINDPNVEKIKADLIGQTMHIPHGTDWTFVSPSEFIDITVNSKEKQGQFLQYDLNITLQDLRTNARYRTQLLVVYKIVGHEWQLVSNACKRFG